MTEDDKCFCCDKTGHHMAHVVGWVLFACGRTWDRKSPDPSNPELQKKLCRCQQWNSKGKALCKVVTKLSCTPTNVDTAHKMPHDNMKRQKRTHTSPELSLEKARIRQFWYLAIM